MKLPPSSLNKRYLLLTNTLSSKTAAATNTIAKNNYFLKATDVVMNNNKFIDPAKNNKLSDDDKKLSTLNYHNNKSFLSKWYFLASISVFACLLMYSVLKDDDDDQDEKVPLLLLDEDGNVIYTRKQKIKIAANDWMFFFYSTLPLNAVSRVWGQLNSLDLPVWLRPYSFKLYSYCFGVNLDEMEQPDLTHYKNLSEFFYRFIKAECRPINFEDDIVMPSDGKVLSLGEIDPITGEIEQVKGINYNVKEFLGTHSHQLMNKSIVEYTPTLNDVSERDLEQTQDIDLEQGLNINTDKHSQIIQDHQDTKHLQVLKDLMDTGKSDMATSREDLKNNKKFMFIVIYLAPGDYHHYHSPTNWLVKIRRHFPGQLYSVSPYFQKNFKNLFILNERVSLLGNWKHGFFSMTPVGATNVGSIKLNFDKDLVTNDKKRLHKASNTKSLDINCYEATYWSQAPSKKEGIPLVMGEEMGGFMLGSTVVLCFEVPKEFQFDCKQGDSVKMGERLGHIESKNI